MSGDKLTFKDYKKGDALIAGPVEIKEEVLKSGEGAIVRGQVLARNFTDGKLVKYNKSGSNGTNIACAIANEAADSTSGDVNLMVIIRGALKRSGLTGIDEVLGESEIATPEAPTVTLQAGGSLTAGTTYTYKIVGIIGSGISAPSATAAIIAANATAGYVESTAAFGAIADVNAALGDCSTNNKTLILNVDGVQRTVVFNANYGGAGALANWAALITKLDVTGVTPTASDGNKIKVASDTTGVNSKVTIVSDNTNLFGDAPNTVNGVAAMKTAKVFLNDIDTAEGIKVFRSTDNFATVSKSRTITEAEFEAGYVTDDGSLTYADETAVTVSDYSAYTNLQQFGFDLIDVISGFNPGYDKD